jgi:hypothetical protein
MLELPVVTRIAELAGNSWALVLASTVEEKDSSVDCIGDSEEELLRPHY